MSLRRGASPTAKDVAQAALKLQYLLALPAKPAVPPKPIDACAWSFEAVRTLQAKGKLSAAHRFAQLAQRQAEQLSPSQQSTLKIEVMPALLVSTLVANDRRTYDLLRMSDAHFVAPGGVKEALASKQLQQNPSPLLRDFVRQWAANTTMDLASRRSLIRLSPWRSQRPEEKLRSAEKKLYRKLVPTVLQSEQPAFVIAVAGSKAVAQQWADAFGFVELKATLDALED